MLAINPLQFNIYLGVLTLIGYAIPPATLYQYIPGPLLAIFLIALFVGDYWAFVFRTKIIRTASLYELSGGVPSKRVGELSEPGCMMYYAFILRLVFRFSVALFSVMLFTGSPDGEAPTWAIILFILVVLFELFNLMYTLFELHIFRIRYEDDDSEDEYWEKEKAWRTKMFKKLNDPNLDLKMFFAGFILVISATAATAMFWDGANHEFVGFIQRSAKDGTSPLFVILLVLIACFVLCLFFLIPVRLAFWLEQLMNVKTKQDKLKYRLSILFAGFSITAPSLIQLVKSYLLGM